MCAQYETCLVTGRTKILSTTFADELKVVTQSSTLTTIYCKQPRACCLLLKIIRPTHLLLSAVR